MAKNITGQPAAAPGGQSRALDLKAIGRGRRMLDVVPQSYDAAERTIELVLSEGSAVVRWYGTEQLSTAESAVNVDRLASSGIPFLDSHMTFGMGAVIGRIVDVWFAEGRILGRAKFAETEAGKTAEGMVSRGEMKGVSIGYRVDTWEVRDADGNVIDASKMILDVDDGLTFTATRWELLEVSLVSVPADPAAMVRSHDAAAEQDLRATPMGKGAREITITRGDASITYRYGAEAPHERAWPESTKGKSMAKQTRADDQGAPKDDDKDARAKRGAKRDDKPKADDDGNLVDADGNYVDADGNKVDEPVKADRSDPMVDDDGFLVDEEGNYIDENGDPAEEPVKARGDDADDLDDDRGARSARSARVAPKSAARDQGRRSAPRFSRDHAAELARIAEQARGQGVSLNLADAIERGLSPTAFRKIAFDELADRSKESQVRGTSNTTVKVLRDEAEGRRDAMELALVTRVLGSRGGDAIDYAPRGKAEKRWVEQHAERAHDYMGMGFVEIAAECLGHRGNIRTARQAIDIIERAFQSTSDFPSIFQNVLNKSLLARYELADPTYKKISIERQFNDFRPHPQIRAGEFPMLQPVTQTGEIKAGKSADSGENITLVPYGVIFPISRQMIVNDELGAIDQILGSSGDAVRLFENTTFFAMFNSNPALMQDGNSVFGTAHGNLAASGTVIEIQTVGAARAVLRAMRSLSGYLLNVPPKIILTGPAQETFAEQITSTINPMYASAVNPFSGRLTPVSDANISDTSWYIMADPNQLPCFVHGFLNGSNGPRVRTFEPFGVQGVQISLEHDFACGAIDFRGGYRNPGALPPN